ncbi:GTP cyclohydrolase I [Veillonella agrestimuris]|uniref:GTP cyclohydrolase I n=1 Tax=Veillonella agrestimuris TaxID=2941340 RepID=UPI00203DE1F8|nr:GTP cyclohydrolase I FolE [Veillonella agrestimuris]
MNHRAQEGIEQFLKALSVDIEAPELAKTPVRVVDLYEDLFSGIGVSTKELWGDIFPTDYAGLVAVTNIPFYSMCEHHLMPFFGTVDVIYEPHNGCVAGLSKFSDVIAVLSKKPQLQERLTKEIADAIMNDLSAEGVFVRLKATQLCMLMKGNLPHGSQVVTIESRGVLNEAGALRDEALAMLGGTDV